LRGRNDKTEFLDGLSPRSLTTCPVVKRSFYYWGFKFFFDGKKFWK